MAPDGQRRQHINRVRECCESKNIPEALPRAPAVLGQMLSWALIAAYLTR